MTNEKAFVCDGCGQFASGEHIARRLQRLEWTTRFRPVHIQTLLLGAFSPHREEEFLYAPHGEFHGEAALLLDAAGISAAGKTVEAVHAEFQRAGFFLTHILECPLEGNHGHVSDLQNRLHARLAAVATRIRRSLKPKRVMAITEALDLVVQDVIKLDLGCPVILDRGRAFRLGGEVGKNDRLREALTAGTGD